MTRCDVERRLKRVSAISTFTLLPYLGVSFLLLLLLAAVTPGYSANMAVHCTEISSRGRDAATPLFVKRNIITKSKTGDLCPFSTACAYVVV
jgi:hypothetical protein